MHWLLPIIGRAEGLSSRRPTFSAGCRRLGFSEAIERTFRCWQRVGLDTDDLRRRGGVRIDRPARPLHVAIIGGEGVGSSPVSD